jgi:N6-adenosine-specific RNA methylase IME4
LLSAEELAELAEDIRRNGQIEPIVLFEEKILDGRNRFAACKLAKVEPRTRELKTCASPTAFVVSANLHRRHLSSAQRSTCAAEALPMFEAEARARQRAAGAAQGAHGVEGGRGKRKTPCAPKDRKGFRAPPARDVAANTFHVGKTQVEAMAKIRDKAPDVFAAVKSGAIGTVADAVRVGRLAPEKRTAVLSAIKSGTSAPAAIAGAVRSERIAVISNGNKPIDGALGRFPVIYADPPWRYEHVKTESRAIENQYPTMDLDAICALPIQKLATDDAVLFMWATSPKLAEAMRVLESWGFTYRTCMVWVKDKIGMGFYARQRHELLLIAARGALPVPEPANRPDSVLEAPLGEHSAKPAAFAELIERMYPEHERVELFCRSPRPGWSVWGNQA